MEKIECLGIYGGTFSPPHNGHYNAVSAFLCECNPDKLIVIPANIPPHKQIDRSDDPQNRLAMTELMLECHPEWQKRLFVSDWEICQKEKSYTVYTLRHFSQYANKLIFLMGTDMLLGLHEWYRPDEICSIADIAFMRREFSDPMLEKRIEEQIKRLESNYAARIIPLSTRAVPLDSTSVRASLKQGLCPDGICPSVYDYIKEHGLYRD